VTVTCPYQVLPTYLEKKFHLWIIYKNLYVRARKSHTNRANRGDTHRHGALFFIPDYLFGYDFLRPRSSVDTYLNNALDTYVILSTNLKYKVY